MDFLVDALFSYKTNSLNGVILLNYDVNTYTSRPVLNTYTTSSLRNKYKELDPMGFIFSEDGILRSDSNVTHRVGEDTFNYILDSFNSKESRNMDLIDLVLYGVKYRGLVLPYKLEEVDTNNIDFDVLKCIAFSYFNVSNSSFNIYASYKKGEEFRTFSLVNIEDAGVVEFYCIFPADVDMSMFDNKLERIRECFYGDDLYILYKSSLGLDLFNANVGEGFLNFLAYNVSFYDIGIQTLNSMKAPLQIEDVTAPKVGDSIKRKKRVGINLSIKHVCSYNKLSEITALLSNKQALKEFIDTNQEAQMTYEWVYNVYNSPWFKKNNGNVPEEKLLYTSCVNMLMDCRRLKLKYALELLCHRYYLYRSGVDGYGVILKGGGVNGESIKRFGV